MYKLIWWHGYIFFHCGLYRKHGVFYLTNVNANQSVTGSKVTSKMTADNCTCSAKAHKLCAESSTLSAQKKRKTLYLLWKACLRISWFLCKFKRIDDRWKCGECATLFLQRLSSNTNNCHHIKSKHDSEILKYQLNVCSRSNEFMHSLYFTVETHAAHFWLEHITLCQQQFSYVKKKCNSVTVLTKWHQPGQTSRTHERSHNSCWAVGFVFAW